MTNGWNGHASLDDIDILKYDSNKKTITRGELLSEEDKQLRQVFMANRGKGLQRNRPTSVLI